MPRIVLLHSHWLRVIPRRDRGGILHRGRDNLHRIVLPGGNRVWLCLAHRAQRHFRLVSLGPLASRWHDVRAAPATSCRHGTSATAIHAAAHVHAVSIAHPAAPAPLPAGGIAGRAAVAAASQRTQRAIQEGQREERFHGRSQAKGTHTVELLLANGALCRDFDRPDGCVDLMAFSTPFPVPRRFSLKSVRSIPRSIPCGIGAKEKLPVASGFPRPKMAEAGIPGSSGGAVDWGAAPAADSSWYEFFNDPWPLDLLPTDGVDGPFPFP